LGKRKKCGGNKSGKRVAVEGKEMNALPILYKSVGALPDRCDMFLLSIFPFVFFILHPTNLRTSG
jgi:hypothetical protein